MQVLFFSLVWDRPTPAGDWTVEYIVQVELNGWLPRGPITSGTITNIRDFLRYLAAAETDWESISTRAGKRSSRQKSTARSGHSVSDQ